MSDSVRRAGWWLPEPPPPYLRENTPERVSRIRFVTAMVIRAWVVVCVGFTGLLWSEPHLNAGQRFFGSVVFVGGTAMALAAAIALVWALAG